jgi:hypothetical protein
MSHVTGGVAGPRFGMCGLIGLICPIMACEPASSLRGEPCNDDEDCGALFRCVSGKCDVLPEPDEIEPTCDFEAVGELEPTLPALTDEIPDVAYGGDHQGTCGGRNASEVVYRWTSPEDAEVTVRVELDESHWRAGVGEPILHVRDGDCRGQELACGHENTGTRTLEVREGQTIYIVVDDLFPGYDYAEQGYRLVVDRADYCEVDTVSLPSEVPVTRTGTTSSNVLSAGICAGGALGYGPEATFRWTAPFAGTFAFVATSDEFDPVVSVREEGCGGQVLDCNDMVSGVPGLGSASVASVEAGAELLVVVDSNDQGGRFELQVRDAFECVPTGHQLDAAALASGVTVDGADATDLPVPDFGQGDKQGVAHRLTAEQAGIHRVEVTAEDDSLAQLAVYRSCFGPLVNADLGGPPGNDVSVSDGEVAFPLDAGDQVVVVVQPVDTATFELRGSVHTCEATMVEGKDWSGVFLPPRLAGLTMRATETCAGFAGLATRDLAVALTPTTTAFYRVRAADWLSVWGGSDLVPAPVLLSAREDSCTGRQLVCVDGVASDDWIARTILPLHAGRTVVLVADGGASGDLEQLHIEVERLR